jgi:cytochrome c oxidase assembly protein subunit 11
MSAAPAIHRKPRASGTRRTAIACVVFAAGMLGAAFAAVPLYDLFCRITGFDGTPMVATSAPGTVGTRPLTVRFDANVNGLAWEFAAERAELALKPGETHTVYYRIRNRSASAATGVATFNVDPGLGSAYFNKIQCFCFTETTLAGGESREVPVVFFIDPEIEKDPDLKNVSTLTLSYTFFAARTPPRPAAAAAASR